MLLDQLNRLFVAIVIHLMKVGESYIFV